MGDEWHLFASGGSPSLLSDWNGYSTSMIDVLEAGGHVGAMWWCNTLAAAGWSAATSTFRWVARVNRGTSSNCVNAISSGVHFIALDHVRAVAVYLVLSWHFIHGLEERLFRSRMLRRFPLLSLLDEGHTGVALFMALSGYLFARLLDGARSLGRNSSGIARFDSCLCW